MRLPKGKKISAAIMLSEKAAPDTRYECKILEKIYQGEHFHIYKAENVNGLHVCIKTIRYRAENKELFSPQEYIAHCRALLLDEHKLLRLSHPCLPEPMAMLAMENDTAEDKRLFKKLPEWEELRYQEPVLVQEYFFAAPLHQISEKIVKFSLHRRLAIISKVAKLCGYLHKNGYLLQNIDPAHILIKPRNDDNIHLVGLHNACRLSDGRADRNAAAFRRFTHAGIPEEARSDSHNYDQRVDLHQLGMLLYYLLTLHQPQATTSGWWNKTTATFSIEQESQRLQKAISELAPAAMWLYDLLQQLTHPLPEFRIPDIETLLKYLKHPPPDRVRYQITKASNEEIEVKLQEIPAGTNRLKVRLEIPGKPKIAEREYLTGPMLSLPSPGIGNVICGIMGVKSSSRLLWWEFQEAMALPVIEFQIREDLPPDKLGLSWNSSPGLSYVRFTAVTAGGDKIDLGQYSGSEALLPPPGMVLPLYENLLIESAAGFAVGNDEREYPMASWPARLLPPIPAPDVQRLQAGLQFKMELDKKQGKEYTEFELLHNDWPSNANIDIESRGRHKTVTLLIPHEGLDIFSEHRFAFRVFISDLGWRTGAEVTITPTIPAVTSLQACEEKPGWVRLNWQHIRHHQVESYEIICQGEKLGRSRTSTYLLKVPVNFLLNNQPLQFAVYGVYANDDSERLSAPATCTVELSGSRTLLADHFSSEVTPIFVKFRLELDDIEILPGESTFVLRRQSKSNDEWQDIAHCQLHPKMVLHDDDVQPGETYRYLFISQQAQITMIDQVVTIPATEIRCQLHHVGYEELEWQIHIPAALVARLDGDITIIRQGEEEATARRRFLGCQPDKSNYNFSDRGLVPGTSYTYLMYVKFKGKARTVCQEMGAVITQVFQLQKEMQVSHDRVCLSWTPSPIGHIDAIEIYNDSGRKLAETRSDSITLENLEPARHYSFPLKYRYPSGRVVDAEGIEFTTRVYAGGSARATDIGSDCFRLRWELPDRNVAQKLKQILLQVSGNVGTHKLSASTRSVFLKQLFPGSSYQWQLMGIMKSGSSIELASGETTTSKPDFICHIEVGLVHHLSWSYSTTPAIDKIEVQRDHVVIDQTGENELFDSDFKGGKEVSYQFYYLLKDGRNIFAAEKKVKALSMGDLFATLKIEPGIGCIRWDFNNLKNFQYLKFLELSRGNKVIYKQGCHIPSIFFRDLGKNGQGLPLTPMDYRLEVNGVAPTARKCKKKWVLNIKGVKCYYPDLPYCFSVAAEHCCIYFEWEYSDTKLLREIIVRRAGDGLVLYQGNNMACTVLDDNRGQGLEQRRKYAYTIEMIYNNYRTSRLIEVALNRFDPSRLELKTKIVGDDLKVTWNNTLETSISCIGWRELSSGWLPKSIKGILQRSNWTDFAKGALKINLPGKNVREFYYQMLYQDCYGHTFNTPVQRIDLQQHS